MQEHKHLNLEHEFVMTMFDLYLATSSSKGSGRSLLEPCYAPPTLQPPKKGNMVVYSDGEPGGPEGICMYVYI